MTYAEWAESFHIFGKVPGYTNVAAEHDELWAGPSADKLPAEDVTRLQALGWRIDPEGGFHTYV